MKTVISLLSIVLFFSAQAQTTTYDLLTYTPPKGWKKTEKPDVVSYAITNTKDGSWCQIAIYQSITSKGDIDTDFTTEWTTLATNPLKAIVTQTNPAQDAGEWKIKTGGGKFIFNKKTALAMLTTYSGFNKCMSILVTSSSEKYLNDVYPFLKELNLNKPVITLVNSGSVTNETLQQSASIPNGYKFNSTNFDDGWTSTIQPDWVEVTKGDTKVLIHYLSSISDHYESNIIVTNKVAWDHFIVPRYTNLTNYEFLKGNMSYIPVYMMAGNLVDRSGKSVFVALFRNGGREQNWMEFIFPNRQRFTQLFGIDKYDDYTKWDALGKMISYNKFAVALSDLKGAWTNSYSGMTQYVYANSGLNAGATSHSSAQEYVIDAAGNYSWNIDVASGVVGNLKFQNAKSTGKLTMTNNWQIHLSNIENKPRDYNVSFSCIKGARLLWIDRQVFVKK